MGIPAYIAPIFALVTGLASVVATAQNAFPPPSKTLYDAAHKEAKSGVQIQGNQIVIQSGVGTPSSINTITFSADGELLAAGKDFGRIVVWSVSDGDVMRVIDSKQGIVSAVALSPDHNVLASAGSEDNPVIALWNLKTGKRQAQFPVSRPPVQTLSFSSDGRWLIVRENGSAYALDVSTGKHFEMPGERLAVVSLDGTEVLSTNGTDFVLRTIGDWKIEKEFSAPSRTSWPLAVDSRQDIYVYGDPTEKESFFVSRLSSNQTIESHSSGLPRFNPSMNFFASILPGHPIVFGHNDGLLWGWNITTGKTCISPILYSESGQLNLDGTTLAGSIDNGILAAKKTQPGVELWDVPTLAKYCGLE
jgi:WD40 repeat protein